MDLRDRRWRPERDEGSNCLSLDTNFPIATDLPVVPKCRKHFCLRRRANQKQISAYPVPAMRGVSRSSRALGGGCGGRGCAFDEWRRTRTAKSCGPDIPTLI